MVWKRRRRHVMSTQQLGETLINHHLQEKFQSCCHKDVRGKKILNVNLNHIASN